MSPCWAPVDCAVSSFSITVLSSSAPGMSSPTTPPSAARGMAMNTIGIRKPSGAACTSAPARVTARRPTEAVRAGAAAAPGLLGSRERPGDDLGIDVLQVEDHGDVAETRIDSDRGAPDRGRPPLGATAASTAAPPARVAMRGGDERDGAPSAGRDRDRAGDRGMTVARLGRVAKLWVSRRAPPATVRPP